MQLRAKADEFTEKLPVKYASQKYCDNIYAIEWLLQHGMSIQSCQMLLRRHLPNGCTWMILEKPIFMFWGTLYI